jgi:hypothetical protein
MLGPQVQRGPRQEIQHRRPGSLTVLVVRGVERRQDHRPAESMHHAQTAAAPQRLPGTVMNGRQCVRRTVESDNHRRDVGRR